MAKKGKRRAAIGCGVVLAVLAVAALSPFGQGVRDLWSHGIVQGLVDKAPERHVAGSSDENLKRLYAAMRLYHRSEEKFPDAAGWNDAVKKRLSADDLAKGEEGRILTRPGAAANGYALNQAVAGKYEGDLSSKGLILLYETDDERADAVGDPDRDGRKGGRGITVDGKLVDLR